MDNCSCLFAAQVLFLFALTALGFLMAMARLLAKLMLGSLWAHGLEEALLADETCTGSDCSLSLLQSRGSARSAASVNISESWQGKRETNNICMWSNCDPKLGPTDCYHFRCICKMDYVYNNRVNQCVHRYSPEGRTARF